MRALNWLWRCFLFIVLFAFAMQNKQMVDLHWFFGYQWQAPMIFIVLAVFIAGCVTGVLAMLPSWWRHRRQARLYSLEINHGKGLNVQKNVTSVDEPATLPSKLPHPPDVVAPRKPVH